MIDTETLMDLFAAFPRSHINHALEFVADPRANEWFRLEDCETRFDAERKVIQFLSRGAFKTEPYGTKKSNVAFHKKQLAGINKFCGTRFTPGDMELIYTYLGNGCHADICKRFIQSGYDMTILKALRAQREADHGE